ncbi:TraR/DksA C4-type zinc finger protein [Haloimpatiens sp. FM7315]|uniref:TraR/DksA C4-type zinc finger protein n=1 Tax=Haloimpatiens sp. FM7315 TaxID=3298609 RepID=UPI00370B5D12
MDCSSLDYFKNKLLKQKKDVESFLRKAKEDNLAGTNRDMENELSNYDNHPADAAGNLYDKERGLAIKDHEISLMNKIDEALEDIQKGVYGKCKMCGKEIIKDRLEFIPYAKYCALCQKQISSKIPSQNIGTSEEDGLLNKPFGYGYNDFKDKVEFDAEDSYQSVERFNRIKNMNENYYEDDDEYVEFVERISNEQYKNQLPD